MSYLHLACSARGPTPLRLATWGSLKEVAILKAWLADRARQHPEAPVELVHVPDAYFQKLPILRAAGRFPDVLFLNSWYLPAFARAGSLLPLDHRTEIDTKAFHPAALEALTFDHRLQALPRDVSNLVVYLDLDMFKARGEPLPPRDWSLTTYLQIARRLAGASSDGSRHFGTAVDPRPIFWFPLLLAAGIDWLHPDGKTTHLDEPAAIRTLEALQELRKDQVAPDERSAGRTPPGQLFVERRLAMWISGRWSVPSLREHAPFRWDVWPMPGGVRVADASGWAISRSTRQPARALALVRDLAGSDLVSRQAASGLIIPARNDVAAQLTHLDRDQAPPHARLFLESLAGAKATRIPPTWPRTALALDRELEPLWNGKRPAREVLPEAARHLATLAGGNR